ncbi:MAG: agmatinase [Dehalococcoidia bacterium]|nr:agmatinase [Dehalococcoidia bacterium]
MREPRPSADVPLVPFSFLALSPQESALSTARAVLVPVPYDGATSYRSGAREGPSAIIAASRDLEDYDAELKDEPSRLGIHTYPEIEPHVGSPDAMVERVERVVRPLVEAGKLVGVLGGDHSVAVGSVRAYLERFPDLSVLYLDAHADLRDEYQGSRYSHACAARRMHERVPLVQVGVRSLSVEERRYIEAKQVPVYFWDPAPAAFRPQEVVALLSPHVYVSVDLDVFDPSLMPAVGTPEPGGMAWEQVVGLLRAVAAERRIVGFDVVELCPREGPAACAFTAARLVYKLIGYALLLGAERALHPQQSV